MAYTAQDAVDEMRDHGFDDTTDTRLLSLLNDAQNDICSREPWPFLEATIDLTFTAGNPIATNWPSNFNKALAVAKMDSSGGSLTPERLETLTKAYNNQLDVTGNPCWYYFIGSQLYVLPVPSASLTARMRYLKTPADVDLGSNQVFTVPVRHARCCTLVALANAYFMEDEPDMGAAFEQRAENRIAAMRNDLWMRQYDRPDRILDIDEDDTFGFDFWS